MNHVAIITLKLRQPLTAESHPGIQQFLTSTVSAPVGDNAFAARTELTASQVAEQLRRHLVAGEYLCVFDSRGGLAVRAYGSEFHRINEVFGGTLRGEDIPPPVP